MARRCGISAALGTWVASLVLLATALVVYPGAGRHAHVDGVDDCAVCKATHAVATLEPTAEVRAAFNDPSREPASGDVAIRTSLRPCVCGPRAPPVL
jgi:hypothetical protein